MEIPLIIWQRYYHLNSLIIALVNWVNSSFSLNQQDQPFIFKLFSVTSASSSSTPPTCILWIPSWISTRVCWMRLSHRSTLKALTECPPHRCVPRYHVAWHEVTWHSVTWRDVTRHDMTRSLKLLLFKDYIFHSLPVLGVRFQSKEHSQLCGYFSFISWSILWNVQTFSYEKITWIFDIKDAFKSRITKLLN